MPSLSKRAEQMPASPIRKLVPFAEVAKKKGKKVYHLNIGQPDIRTSELSIKAINNYSEKVIEYSHSAGNESYRKKLATYYLKIGVQIDHNQILITTGGSEALLFTLLATMNPGDEVIVPEPYYTNYNGFAVEAGVCVVPITSTIETGFALPDIKDFEKVITKRTKAIMICNPNNPTGYLYSKEELLKLRDLVLKYDLFLIADEVYREFVYDGNKHISVLELEGLEKNAILIDSVSKRYSMCGVRTGALLTRNTEVYQTILKFGQARLSPPSLGQVAGEAAVDTPDQYFKEVYEEYLNRRNLVIGALNKIEGVYAPMPKGAFYTVIKLPVNDAEHFCQWILEEFDYQNETVMLAPASGFYATEGLGKDEARIAYVLNLDDLKKAVKCLEEALKVYPGRKNYKIQITKYLNLELYIAKRLFFSKENKGGISNSVISIAIFGIALGMAVMILSVAVVTGFKEQVRQKVTGFASHILISKYDTNNSYEASPINKNQDFYPSIENIEGVSHIQIFATKAGIIKTKTDIQGVVLKGVGKDFDWQFFKNCLTKGEIFNVVEGKKTDDVIISAYLASLLKLKVGDPLFMYFMHDPIKMRSFKISGIYSTDLQELDKLFVLVDIAHVQKLNDWSENQINGFEITVDDFDKLDEMTALVSKKVGAKYYKGKEQLTVKNIKDLYPQIFDWLELTNTNVWVILGLMVIVSVFNMISGLFVIILEKTNMIGILKALGAKNFSISKVFLYNAAFLISKGLLYGNLIGIGFGILQSHFKFIKLDPSTYYIDSVPINLKIWHILLLNISTLIITTLMLLIPSLIISRIRPAKAIKFA